MKSYIVGVSMFSLLILLVLMNPIDSVDLSVKPIIRNIFEGTNFDSSRQKRCLFFCHGKRVHYNSYSNVNEDLFNAAAQGVEYKIKKYIRRGANVNYVNENGETPLIAASYSGDPDAVEILISNGANINHRNNYGDTALSTAAFYNHKRCVELLIKKGANIDSRNVYGDTALHLAARGGHKMVVDLLKSNGANGNIRNNHGKTAMETAVEAGQKKVVEVLGRFGDATQVESIGTTNSPFFVQTTNSPIITQPTQIPIWVQTTRLSDVVRTTKSPIVLSTVKPPTVVTSPPREAIRNACESYVRFSKSIPTADVRILGGVPAKDQEFPWMAALGHLGSDLKVEFNCGGTLISDSFVLTAAHCVKNSLRLVLIRLGKLKLTDDDGLQAVDRFITAEDIISHPDYSSISKLNDIALIRIKKVKFQKNVIPACLHTNSNDMHSNVELIVTGWGTVSAERVNKSSVLLKTQLKTMSITECSSMLSNNQRSNLTGLKNITKSQYCAYDPEAKNDSCKGDSGGPLQVFVDNSPVSTVVGIVSFGISCGTALPAVYTRVASYLDWIESYVWPNIN